MNATREIVPLHAADISAFCKNLRQQLAVAEVANPPSHLRLLNMLAKSAGYRNFQELRATPPQAAVEPVVVVRAIVAPRGGELSRTVKRTLSNFDTAGRLMRWPTQFAVQQLAIWGLWLRLPGKRDLSEADVNRYLSEYHTFGDAATLRRELVNAKMLWRTTDCSVYRKLMHRPEGDAQDFVRELLMAAPKVKG